MTKINEDVILELTQYLDIFTSLCLAQSCGAAFRASQVYSFWSPHELPPSLGLAVFLPDDHIGPWRSYSGDELRQAVIKMRDFRSRWDSEQVSASHRVNVGRHSSLEGIPGSRWLCAFQYGLSSTGLVRIVDGKTGISTIHDLDLDPIGPRYVSPPPVVYSLEPNRILIGGSGENDARIWSFALFEITLSVNEKDGGNYIEAHSTRIHVWKNIPALHTAFMIHEFLVIWSKPLVSPSWDVEIYHMSSKRHWEWHAISNRFTMSLVDQWYILTERRPEMVYIVAIHLPSLLYLPAPTSQSLIPPNGTDLRTGQEPAGGFYQFDIIPPSDSTSRHKGTSEYTVILSRASHRFAFDIRMDVVPGSIHGNIVWPGTRLSLQTNQQLEKRTSSQFSRDNSFTDPLREDSTAPLRFRTIQPDAEVLVVGFNLGYHIQILRMTNLSKSDHTRSFFWKGPLKHRTGASAMVEMEFEGDPDTIVGIPYWDAGTGMLLLQGPRLSSDLKEYQTCWF